MKKYILNFKRKKSFALLVTIILMSLLAYGSIYIFELKSLSNTNNKNNYLYKQATLHLEFFISYLKYLENIEYKKIELKDKKFKIYALIDSKCNKEKNICAEIFIQYKDTQNSISLYEKVILK